MNTQNLINESLVFSYFRKPISNTHPLECVDLKKVYELITGDSFIQTTIKLREITDNKQARTFKSQNFDSVTFSGVFTSREDNALVKHSGLIAIDFDHVSDLHALRTALITDPLLETALLFTSPSGDGIKWIVTLDLEQNNHADYFNALSNYIKQTYLIQIDTSGRNVSRACFLSHDPNCYINPKFV